MHLLHGNFGQKKPGSHLVGVGVVGEGGGQHYVVAPYHLVLLFVNIGLHSLSLNLPTPQFQNNFLKTKASGTESTRK